jgi:pSer/pThr/pTyr-binding forkhead associated (FHA) protein
MWGHLEYNYTGLTTMKKNLDRLEAQLRALFEDKLTEALTGKSTSTEWVDELVRVMQANLDQNQDGVVVAPDRYFLEVSPEDFAEWQECQTFLDEMAAYLSEWGSREGFHFPSDPVIQLHENQALSNADWQIRAEFSVPDETLPDTAAMDGPELPPEEDLIPTGAFLVVGGKLNFPLLTVVVNIGRHSDNDLVIDDQYISRHHAQLRAINRRYVIFDVGSTGGIELNGKPVTQTTLHPGDVIRIGMTHLIYVQDTTGDLPTTALPSDPEAEEDNL